MVKWKTFIWSADGWAQHIKAMVYYAKWVRLVFRTVLVEHSLQIPFYSFSIGYGADILTTFQYYGVGDPITSLCVLVPVGYMQYFYALCVYIRLFLAGLFFSWFCFETKKIENTNHVLTACLVYIFSGYSMTSVCHPFFLVAILWTPLILVGVEKVWDGNGIVVSKENAEIALKAIQITGGELYFSINGLTYEEYSDMDYYREHNLLSKMNTYERRKMTYEELHKTPEVGASIVVGVDTSGQHVEKFIGVYNENYRY